MERLIKDTLKEYMELNPEDGSITEYIDKMPNGRRKRTSLMLYNITSYTRQATEKKYHLKKTFRKIPRITTALEHFDDTVGNIDVLVQYYVIKDDNEAFEHLLWVEEVLKVAIQELETLRAGVTDEDNNSATLKVMLFNIIRPLAKAKAIISPFIVVNNKLQYAYSLEEDLATLEYNFVSLNAKISIDTFPLRDALRGTCGYHFSQLELALDNYLEELEKAYMRKELCGEHYTTDDETDTSETEQTTL
jgi:hypothetical protein